MGNHYHRLALLLAAAGLVACRGDFSEDPPIHFNPNMDQQKRFDPQEPSADFRDERAMRRPVPGTVARGELRTDRHLYEGRDGRGGFAIGVPSTVAVNRALFQRGQDRFRIYCAPCHGHTGRADGVVFQAQAGLPRPANFHEPRLQAMPLGQFVYTMVHGKGNMQRMSPIVPPRDRWAIAVWIRALQRSQDAALLEQEGRP